MTLLEITTHIRAQWRLTLSQQYVNNSTALWKTLANPKLLVYIYTQTENPGRWDSLADSLRDENPYRNLLAFRVQWFKRRTILSWGKRGVREIRTYQRKGTSAHARTTGVFNCYQHRGRF